MNPRNTGILFLLAVALGAFVWFYEVEGEDARKEAEAAEKRLFPEIESADVKWVSLTTRDGAQARLERGEEGWSLTEPLAFPADAFAADGLASNLAELASEAVLENPQPLEEYGLGDGARRVGFGVGDGQHALRVGNKTPVGSNSYAQVEGQDTVVTIPTYRATSFDKSLTDLRERRILELDTASIQTVEASWPDGGVSLERVVPAPPADGEEAVPESGSGWRLTAPIEGRADDEVVKELLSDLSFLRAEGFVDDPSPELLADFDAPEFDVVLRGAAEGEAEAPSWRLHIGPVYEGDKRLVQTGRSSLYTIAADRISDFPRKLALYRFRRLADFRVGDAQQVDFFFQPSSGDPVAASALRGEDGWTTSPGTLVPGKLAALVSELATLEAADIVSEDADEEQLRAAGLAPPNTILTVFGAAEEPAKEGETPTLPVLAEIHLGNVEGSEWILARAAGNPAIYRLGYELAEHLPVSLEAFRNRFLADADAGAEAKPAATPTPNSVDFLTPSEESP